MPSNEHYWMRFVVEFSAEPTEEELQAAGEVIHQVSGSKPVSYQPDHYPDSGLFARYEFRVSDGFVNTRGNYESAQDVADGLAAELWGKLGKRVRAVELRYVALDKVAWCKTRVVIP